METHLQIVPGNFSLSLKEDISILMKTTPKMANHAWQKIRILFWISQQAMLDKLVH